MKRLASISLTVAFITATSTLSALAEPTPATRGNVPVVSPESVERLLTPDGALIPPGPLDSAITEIMQAEAAGEAQVTEVNVNKPKKLVVIQVYGSQSDVQATSNKLDSAFSKKLRDLGYSPVFAKSDHLSSTTSEDQTPTVSTPAQPTPEFVAPETLDARLMQSQSDKTPPSKNAPANPDLPSLDDIAEEVMRTPDYGSARVTEIKPQ